jgi:hypothetical protein
MLSKTLFFQQIVSMVRLALAWATGIALNIPIFCHGWQLVDRHPELLLTGKGKTVEQNGQSASNRWHL